MCTTTAHIEYVFEARALTMWYSTRGKHAHQIKNVLSLSQILGSMSRACPAHRVHAIHTSLLAIDY